jgi:hypothetical protein
MFDILSLITPLISNAQDSKTQITLIVIVLVYKLVNKVIERTSFKPNTVGEVITKPLDIVPTGTNLRAVTDMVGKVIKFIL